MISTVNLKTGAIGSAVVTVTSTFAQGRAGLETGCPYFNVIALFQRLRCKFLFSVVCVFWGDFRRNSQEVAFSEQKNSE